MNILAAFSLAGQIIAAVAELSAGIPVPIRTYIDGKHVEITIQEIA